MPRELRPSDVGYKLSQPPQLTNFDTKEAINVLLRYLEDMADKINGQISLGNAQSGFKAGDLDAGYCSFLTHATPSTEFEVIHDLGRVPVGFEVVYKDGNCDVWAVNPGSWGDKTIRLKADAAGVSYKIRLF